MKRVQMFFAVTVVVDVDEKAVEQTAEDYAKKFVGLTTIVYGNQDVARGDKIVRRLNVIEVETTCEEAFVIA